jgi:mono/diheme cytochrome c family protein
VLRLLVIVLGVAFAVVAFAVAGCTEYPKADPEDRAQVSLGKRVYETHCASCHGAKLEGQPNWRERLPNGRFPAPPHDETGHTWHHSDAQLFGITKRGMTPFAPPGHESDMPTFGDRLADREIWAVLAYIKSSWPEAIRNRQAKVSAADAAAGP